MLPFSGAARRVRPKVRGSEVSPVEVSPSDLEAPPVGENQGPVAERERVEGREEEGMKEGEERTEGRMEEPEDAPGEEQRKVNVPLGPSQPTAREIAEHEASGHAVHRSWCVHCMRARGNVQSHPRTVRSGEGEVPTLHADYFFLGSDGEREDIMPHLVVRCDRTRRTWATSLPQKGVHPFNTNWFCSIVREAGWKRMILFSDGEPALVALKQAVVENMRDVEITLKESPTSVNEENAPSNGYAECAVREVKRMIRATLSDLESKLQLKIDPNHSILTWIARHAAFLLTRFRIGDDGKSAYQRAVGREWRRPTVVFGEQILFKPVGALGKKRSSPLEPRVAMGRYVGTASRNADLLVMTPTGVVKGHSLHRRAEEDRWSKEGFDQLRGLPWKWTNPVERAPPNRVDMPELVGEQPKPDPKEFRARSLYVLKSDLAKYGYTTLCPGCRCWICHSEATMRNVDFAFRDT